MLRQYRPNVMIDEFETSNVSVKVAIVAETKELVDSGVVAYKREFHPAGYGTRVIGEGVDQGFLGSMCFAVVSRSASCD